MAPHLRYIFGALGLLVLTLAIGYFAVSSWKRHAQREAVNFRNAQQVLPTQSQVAQPIIQLETRPRPGGAERLVAAYPEQLASIEGNVIRWKDGTLMPYDDGVRNKTIDQLFNRPSLYDQMAMAYTAGADYPRTRGQDPGRVRYQPFFLKMYGSSEKAVKARLRPVIWLPSSSKKRLMMTSINGVDKKLQAISDEIDVLPASMQKHVNENIGTFKWRFIAGTKRLSTHSFGIAIDFNTPQAQYWRKLDPHEKGDLAHTHALPPHIIEIFEKHGFIWGGKWYHYDTMHFEYRPELL